jgi:hypothetical protein
MKNRAMKKPKSPKRGQTMLEFVFVLVLFVFMLSVTYNAVLAFSLHQYMAYATFMSARAYQAAGASPANQLSQAQAALTRYIPGLPYNPASRRLTLNEMRFGQKLMAKEVVVDFPDVPSPEPGLPRDGDTSPERGVIVRFKVPFAIVPIGQALSTTLSFFQMKVISYLGREVTVQECRSFFAARPGAGPWANYLDDTGC